jgi:hypothetical protein
MFTPICFHAQANGVLFRKFLKQGRVTLLSHCRVEPSFDAHATLREMISDENADSLERKGYFCAERYFSEEEVRELQLASRADYDHGQYPKGTMQSGLLPPVVRAKVERLLGEINRTTSLHLDSWHGAAEDDDVLYMASYHFHDWHQDHESYYASNDHFNYVNLYVPISKPNRAKTNLCVVPFDKLRDVCKPLHDVCYNGGAARYTHYRPPGGKVRCMRLDDAQGTNEVYDCDLELLKETPQLGPGDALVIRGDTLHRTEDLATVRTVLSLRIFSSRSRARCVQHECEYLVRRVARQLRVSGSAPIEHTWMHARGGAAGGLWAVMCAAQ